MTQTMQLAKLNQAAETYLTQIPVSALTENEVARFDCHDELTAILVDVTDYVRPAAGKRQTPWILVQMVTDDGQTVAMMETCRAIDACRFIGTIINQAAGHHDPVTGRDETFGSIPAATEIAHSLVVDTGLCWT